MLDIAKSLLLSFFAIAVLLPVVRYALRRMAPSTAIITLDAEELKYLQKQEWKLTFSYFFFACILSVFSAGILSLASSIVNISRESMYVLTPNFRAFFAPGLLLGLTLALIPLYLVQNTVLGQDYEMYKNYLSHIEGRNSYRYYGRLFIILLLLSAITAWFALRWHVSISDEKVQVTNLLNESRIYDTKDIASIRFLGTEGEYLISFDDNSSINTAYLKPVPLEMIALLSARSDKRVIR